MRDAVLACDSLTEGGDVLPMNRTYSPIRIPGGVRPTVVFPKPSGPFMGWGPRLFR